jgi:hypothetical protein
MDLYEIFMKLRAVIHRPNIQDGGTNAETIR